MDEMKCIHAEIERFVLLPTMQIPWREDGSLLYFVQNMSTKLAWAYQRTEIDAAFARWNYHLEKHNKEFCRTEHPEEAFVVICFVGGDTGLEPPLDYRLVMLQKEIVAFWAEQTGNIYIKDNMPWGDKADELSLTIAIEHEIGHLLGIGHTTASKLDIMYFQYDVNNRITQDTIRALDRIFNKRYLPRILDLALWEVLFILLLLYILYTIISEYAFY